MLRKSATTTPKQLETTCFGKDWRHTGWARDLQSATVFPGIILPFRYTCKKGTAAISFSGPQTHWMESKKWSSPVALKACWLNKTNLIYLRNVKSFVFRAGRKVPHCQKWDCHVLPLSFGQGHFELFSISILMQARPKTGAPNALERVVILFLGRRLERTQLLQKFARNHGTTKGLKESQLCDSRRLRKKPQDAQDDVTELFDFV